ncbi:unnamed protein product [marine sediment metagenome]|uniref:Uncharacterized protein n=1 Tax=marine sediment metagenome TaxID=412755 RepID=X1BRW7_9ZZZZ
MDYIEHSEQKELHSPSLVDRLKGVSQEVRNEQAIHLQCTVKSLIDQEIQEVTEALEVAATKGEDSLKLSKKFHTSTLNHFRSQDIKINNCDCKSYFCRCREQNTIFSWNNVDK